MQKFLLISTHWGCKSAPNVEKRACNVYIYIPTGASILHATVGGWVSISWLQDMSTLFLINVTMNYETSCYVLKKMSDVLWRDKGYDVWSGCSTPNQPTNTHTHTNFCKMWETSALHHCVKRGGEGKYQIPSLSPSLALDTSSSSSSSSLSPWSTCCTVTCSCRSPCRVASPLASQHWQQLRPGSWSTTLFLFFFYFLLLLLLLLPSFSSLFLRSIFPRRICNRVSSRKEEEGGEEEEEKCQIVEEEGGGGDWQKHSRILISTCTVHVGNTNMSDILMLSAASK